MSAVKYMSAGKEPKTTLTSSEPAQASGILRKESHYDDAICVQNKEVSSAWTKFSKAVFGTSVMPLTEFL